MGLPKATWLLEHSEGSWELGEGVIKAVQLSLRSLSIPLLIPPGL